MPLPLVPIAAGIAGSIAGSTLGSMIEKAIRGEYDPAKDRQALRQERMKHIYEKTASGMSLEQASSEVDQEIEAAIAQKEAEYNQGGGETGALIGSVVGGGAGALAAKGLKKGAEVAMQTIPSLPRLGMEAKNSAAMMKLRSLPGA